ncbi:MAG: hypothetical protein WD226_12620 [Planctomycetota bacterium]
MLALALTFLFATDVTVLSAPPGGRGDVLVVDETGVAPIQRPDRLQGVRLLELDVSGRTTLETWLPGRARRVTDVGPGAARLVLPGAEGSLYRYERRSPLVRGTRFGLLRVTPQGRPQVVFERVGTGVGGHTDPFRSTVGVATDGRAALVATSLAAGGDVFEVDLALGTHRNRTPNLPPLDVAPGGLRLLPSWGACVAATGVVRFDRTPAATASVLDLGAPTPTYFQGELVASEDGSTLATVAGAGPQLAHVFVFGQSGAAVRVTETASHLGDAGFATSTDSGPYLALAPDGAVCAWTTLGVARELFARHVALAAPVSDHVSSDARFLDTLDEISSIRFITPDSFTFVLGALDLPEATVEDADVFLGVLDPATGVVSITNLSGTSGDHSSPFTSAGTLKTEGGIFALEGLDGYLLHDDQSSNTGSLKLIRTSAPEFITLLPDAGTLEAFAVSDSIALGLIERNLPGEPREFWSLDLNAAPVLQAQGWLPQDSALVTLRPDGDARFAYVRQTLFGRRLGRIDAASGTQLELGGPALPLSDAVGWTSASGIVCSADVAGQGYAALWSSAGVPTLLGSAAGGLVVLPSQ